MANRTDTLGSGTGQFDLNWDWKKEYMGSLSNSEEGMERFSQLSATPDTTAIFGGPARFRALAGGSPAAKLLPIGMVSNLTVSSGVGVVRLFEIGSNRSFFTRGKAAPSLNFGRMLADQRNIISTLLKNANVGTLKLNDGGTAAPGAQGAASDIMMNLDSEYTNIPFGMLLVLKTKGSNSDSNRGKVLSAIYLESCMMEGYGFSIDSSAPVIQEGISIQLDRVVPVAIV